MEARYFKKQGRSVQCILCPHNCIIEEGRKGFCRARKNIDGKLISLVYGRPAAINIDPIEKKPLYHFLPGSVSLSFGTLGCNLACAHCQNYDISCADPEKIDVAELPPEEVLRIAKEKGCESISYTYNEPTVFFEYAMDCAKLAKKAGIKNVLVTNGFINPEPAKEFCKVMDAANVDIKAWSEDFYRKVTRSSLKPVIECLRIYKKKMWIEVTNLIIDGKNNDMKEIEGMCKWIAKELGKDTPLHFSRAFPMNRMLDIRPTPIETLMKAREIAKKHLDFVYLGNIGDDASTNCPKCGALLVSRKHYNVINGIRDGKCCCGHRIAGVF